jgi:hypothetical protein
MRLKHLLPLFALLAAVVTAACSPNVRAVGRGLEAGAIEAQREIESMRRAGEIEGDAARQYAAVFSEVESNGHGLTLIVNWNSMARAEKRRTILQQIGYFEASARRLDEAGVLGIKSARSRWRVEEFKRNFQRGLGALRIIAAAIPDEKENPAASPTPAPQSGTH